MFNLINRREALDGVHADIVEDTICNGVRLTTLKIRYHRMIHAEALRHRTFARGAGSSRAIPVAKMAASADATPVSWGTNQAGMQAGADLTGWRLFTVQLLWLIAMHVARRLSIWMAKAGAHKQLANRLTEPYQWMTEIITGTDWDNFFNLRDHEKAQPEIQVIARKIRAAMALSEPRQVGRLACDPLNWHLPFVLPHERIAASEMRYDSSSPMANCYFLAKLSSARCARVSYWNHDGSAPQVAKDLGLFDKLTEDPRAIHASPMEHPAHPLSHGKRRVRNFRGWKQFRVMVEAGEVQ